MKRSFTGSPLMLLMLLLASLHGMGQVTSRVTGVVQDKTGAVIPSASVTLTNQDTNVSFTAKTTSAGSYVFDAVKPGIYKLEVVVTGFKTFDSSGNVVTIGEPAVINAVLEIGAISERVEVNGSAELVQTSTSGNLGNLFDNVALNTLPIVTTRGRNTLSLVELEPGVVDPGGFNRGGPNIAGGGVYVNGARDRAWNYTLDGIDINETSAGGANFSPLRTNPDMLAEFRVLTSNPTAEFGRNSGGQVEMVTRAGTNNFHGSGYFFYQTPGFNANAPENIEAGLVRPQFIQKIYGFALGGPIKKDKTFFFANFQWLRTLLTTINTAAVFTPQARNGTLRFIDQNSPICQTAYSGSCFNAAAGTSNATVDASGNPTPGVTVDSYNVVANDPLGLGLDPSVQAMVHGSKIPAPNNYTIGDGLNVAGFSWLAAEHEKQLDYTVRVDHTFNAAHSVFVRWSAGHQNTLGDTVNGGLPVLPGFSNVVDTYRAPKNLAVNWRWSMNPRMLNEFVLGMSRFSFNFANPDSNFNHNPPFDFFADPICAQFGLACMSVPLQNYVGNARVLTTYQLVDNMSHQRGPHAFKWGINFRYQRHIDKRGSIGNLDAAPAINFDPTVNQPDPTAYKYGTLNIDQGQDAVDLQGFINDLLGRVGAIQQGIVAQDPSTWAPPGTLLHADFRMPEYDFYGQDTWRVRPNFVLDLGLRWEVKLSPRVTRADNMLRPNGPIGWGFSSDNLSWLPGSLYKDALKSFGPSIGFAWDLHGNAKTSIRGNFRIAYDRINTFSLSSAIFQNMPGLSTQISDTTFAAGTSSCGGTDGRLSTLTPTVFDCVIARDLVQTPTQLRTPPPFSNNAITVVDPNWTPPQTYMWSFGIQHELPQKFVLEMNYLGRKAVHLYGAYDANQAKIRSNGFLNAFNSVAAGNDSPLMDQLMQAVPGYSIRPSQDATGSAWLFDPNGGNPYHSQLVNGRVAGMAASLEQNGVDVAAGLGPTFFYSYPQFSGFFPSSPGGFVVLDSHDFSTYNALQTQLRRAFSNGLTMQAAYTWSKSLDTRSFDPTFTVVAVQSTPFGASSTPVDLDHRRWNYAPSDFDIAHLFQGIWVYELPFGHGKRWGQSLNRVLDRIVGGWEIGGFAIMESGRPTTIFSGSSDYTLSSIVRTVADCSGCSPNMFQIHRDPATGKLTYLTPDQIAKFSTPGPGQFSNVGRNFFRLAGYKTLNMSLGKKFRITESQALEMRLEAQNVTNSVHYDEPASNRYTNPSFGVVDPLVVSDAGRSLSSEPRKMQVSAKYTF